MPLLPPPPRYRDAKTFDRERSIERLRTEKFDVVILGGGAVGCGIALDASAHGLRVALIEARDFASGTSGRSTKLLHGGVRYLEAAVKKLDRSQYALVKEALHERTTLLRIAPHLAHPLALLTPIYRMWEGPYYRAGLRVYDWLAGVTGLAQSRWLGPEEALQAFPTLRQQNLRGAVVYYDGQFDDARMNVSLARTAAAFGAVAANHLALERWEKAPDGRLRAAVLKDQFSGATLSVEAPVFVNATGPLVDSVRRLSDPGAEPLLTTSSGTHIVLPGEYSTSGTGLLVPKTSDGRVLFALPWLGHTLVGTTDRPCDVTADPRPEPGDEQFLLDELGRMLDRPVPPSAVRSIWCGLRPLPHARGKSTKSVTRDHFVVEDRDGLVTVGGGKWTTYRKMARDATDHIAHLLDRRLQGPSTDEIALVGAAGFDIALAVQLESRYSLSPATALHLVSSYGSEAARFAEWTKDTDGSALITEGHPFVNAEIAFAARWEMARTVEDVLARRMRLAFLDASAAVKAVPDVARRLGAELQWSDERTEIERKRGHEALSGYVPSGSRVAR